jgi:uncharacterized membrane protein YfcA
MTPLEALGLALAAFVGGGINAVAGGGSLISFPALLAAGYPTVTANVTNTVALWPGYVGGSLGYRALLIPQARTVAVLAITSVLGALTGSAILLMTSEATFSAIVPFLILFAAVVLTFQPQLSRLVARIRRPWDAAAPTRIPLELHPVVFLLAVYGAYFGAGLGTMTLAALSILLPDDLQRSNALKGMLSLIINAVAVVFFALFGPVEWAPAAVMAIAGLAGGYLGVGLARRMSSNVLRLVVVVYSLVVAVVLMVR